MNRLRAVEPKLLWSPPPLPIAVPFPRPEVPRPAPLLRQAEPLRPIQCRSSPTVAPPPRPLAEWAAPVNAPAPRPAGCDAASGQMRSPVQRSSRYPSTCCAIRRRVRLCLPLVTPPHPRPVQPVAGPPTVIASDTDRRSTGVAPAADAIMPQARPAPALVAACFHTTGVQCRAPSRATVSCAVRSRTLQDDLRIPDAQPGSPEVARGRLRRIARLRTPAVSCMSWIQPYCTANVLPLGHTVMLLNKPGGFGRWPHPSMARPTKLSHTPALTTYTAVVPKLGFVAMSETARVRRTTVAGCSA